MVTLSIKSSKLFRVDISYPDGNKIGPTLVIFETSRRKPLILADPTSPGIVPSTPGFKAPVPLPRTQIPAITAATDVTGSTVNRVTEMGDAQKCIFPEINEQLPLNEVHVKQMKQRATKDAQGTRRCDSATMNNNSGKYDFVCRLVSKFKLSRLIALAIQSTEPIKTNHIKDTPEHLIKSILYHRPSVLYNYQPSTFHRYILQPQTSDTFHFLMFLLMKTISLVLIVLQILLMYYIMDIQFGPQFLQKQFPLTANCTIFTPRTAQFK
ncbi:unnamed protein product [Didymodactylos carnosus]|uniref:Uncharacterized protein n=1 Tax=Didymodactylos carnosus TaxID=1234261 RepID=A0A8S2DQR2_9BILA|nr:unnamed protein product [Didymodactylos carnosus]CAF3724508.1 unnamed protein product [Didymodactylos carnosus]